MVVMNDVYTVDVGVWFALSIRNGLFSKPVTSQIKLIRNVFFTAFSTCIGTSFLAEHQQHIMEMLLEQDKSVSNKVKAIVSMKLYP